MIEFEVVYYYIHIIFGWMDGRNHTIQNGSPLIFHLFWYILNGKNGAINL